MLSKHVTLNDLVASGLLGTPARYLRMALGNMLLVAEFGAVTLRIGSSGRGTAPSYILEGGADGKLFRRFDGDTHQPWTGVEGHNPGNWSTSTMDGIALHQLWRQVTIGK